MKTTNLFGCFVGGIFGIYAVTIQAATIANWTFETSVPTTAGPIAPEVGAGSGTIFHSTTGSVTYSNPTGNGSVESWSTNNWLIGDYFQFQTSTLGESGITFTWDQTRSSSGPGQPFPTSPNFRLQYSTDGTNFTNVMDYLVPTGDWTVATTAPFSQNLSAVTALDNQSAVYFRLTAIQGAQSANGTTRVDNILVTSVPEPAAGFLLITSILLAAVQGASLRRR